MKQIRVIIRKEFVVDVTVDDTVVNHSALDGIQEHYDDDLFEEPWGIDEDVSKYDCGLYNYATAAALQHLGIQTSEFMFLDNNHTQAKIESEDVDTEVESMINI